jgi:hypothetical protein
MPVFSVFSKVSATPQELCAPKDGKGVSAAAGKGFTTKHLIHTASFGGPAC